ncbi:alpha-hydroxy acid oxidase [Thalassospira sp.]|uniref:alpha-hydroxy acid oxidase n=1 Tax=Thalassospira sp. TaxID=1912094 RepID=UPI001B154D98|nr:alpha-hydroxy acid oxidase [Thalassospira sp.]MBO6805958.1 alpha-hydroxy-acid oxidizing protein [Thalassospira sp.]
MIGHKSKIEKTINVAPPISSLREVQERASGLVPPQAWDWLEGGSEYEVTIAANRSGFSKVFPVQRVLRDVSNLDASLSFLGESLSFPLIAAPLGGLTQYHLDGEIALAAGCHRAGSIASIGAMARLRMEEVRDANPNAPIIYQAYLQGPTEWLEEQVERANSINVKALCICADAPTRFVRYRDRDNRYDARRFGRMTNSRPPSHEAGKKANWDLITLFRQLTEKPIILKGIMCVEDAVRAVDAGVDYLWVSNHGGRVMDSGVASIEMLPLIRRAVGKEAKIIFDGGVRCGSDMFKAIALGADLVAIGRQIVYGLAVDGAAGVERIFELYKEEFESVMAACGVTGLSQITPQLLQLRPSAAEMLDMC